MDPQDAFQDSFAMWRRSYLRLRMLERNLVSETRCGKDPAKIAALYAKVDDLRRATSELFQLAQTASMQDQIPAGRSRELST